MVAQRRADGRAHADVHAAVAGDHDEGEVVLQPYSSSSPRRLRSQNISTTPDSVAAPFWNRLWMYVALCAEYG